jgi:hypothetical protein
MIDFPDRDDERADVLGNPELESNFLDGENASTGVQHTLAIGDGDTYVTDDDLSEDTSVNVSDPELEDALSAMVVEPSVGLPTEEEVLRRSADGDDDEDNGEDPVPVPA